MRPKIYVEFTTFSASFRVLSSYELCVTLPKRTELCQIRQFRMKERGLYHRVSDKLRRVLFSGSKAIISQYSCKNSVEPSFFFISFMISCFRVRLSVNFIGSNHQEHVKILPNW